MLNLISDWAAGVWGPFRLLGSYAFMMAAGTLAAALLVQFFLPRLWHRLPLDHGKPIVGKEGMKSKDKPTGGGLFVTLLMLPVLLLAVPLTWDMALAFAFLYFAMLCGYLDDRATVPWGQLRKGLLDVVAALGVAVALYIGQVDGTGNWHGVAVWVPFWKGMWLVPWYWYIPAAAFFLWCAMNFTNCSDGVDGLAGSLSVVALVCFAAVLYLVIANTRMAHYFLIEVGGTASRCAARWAVALMCTAGAFSGYLWWNAAPSQVLMGDAGSRFLGLLIGAGALATGNPFLVLAFMPVMFVNGGAGLAKIVLLRGMKKAGADMEAETKNPFVRALRAIRCPLHDHCRKKWKWSGEQVLMRFVLLQLFLIPLLFVLFVKIR